jgi:hypothetical protein
MAMAMIPGTTPMQPQRKPTTVATMAIVMLFSMGGPV